MKLVIPVLSLETGGTRFIYQLANEMVDKGHSVEIVLPENASVAWPLRTKITRVKKLTPDTIPPADSFFRTFIPQFFRLGNLKKAESFDLALAMSLYG